MTTRSPTFAEMLRQALDSRLADVHVAIPARVESYDAADQRAVVQPLIKRGYTTEQGARAAEALPAVAEVPVVFPGAGAYSITWPLAPGDTVLLVFSETSLDRWLTLDGQVDPEDERRHHLSDAIAIPGLRSFRNPTDQVADALVVAADDIRLGSKDASDPVALKSDLDAIKAAINGAAVVANDGGAAFKTNILDAWPTSVGATKVKAE